MERELWIQYGRDYRGQFKIIRKRYLDLETGVVYRIPFSLNNVERYVPSMAIRNRAMLLQFGFIPPCMQYPDGI